MIIENVLFTPIFVRKNWCYLTLCDYNTLSHIPRSLITSMVHRVQYVHQVHHIPTSDPSHVHRIHRVPASIASPHPLHPRIHCVPASIASIASTASPRPLYPSRPCVRRLVCVRRVQEEKERPIEAVRTIMPRTRSKGE